MRPATNLTRGGVAGKRIGDALLLCCVTIIAYLPALRAGFIWDDDTLVTGNALVRSGSGILRIWFTTQPADYWPVTLTAFWMQWRLWGMHAAGYHAVNVALHVAEALLLWGVFRRLGLRHALLGAFLFAVHPVNVETVAWISELKNLMAMLFFLLSVRSFLGTELWAGPAGDGKGIGASLAFFTLGMLSKGSVAVLPLVLVGLIAWKRRVGIRDLLRLAPFFAVGAALVLVDIWFQKHGTGEVIRQAGPVERLLGAGAVVWFYLGKALWPVGLIFVYPQWHIRAGDPLWWIPLLGAVGLTIVLWRIRAAWARAALFGWGFFCVALVPVMGFTDVYFMKYSLVADRYGHLALVGIAGLAAAAWERVNSRAAAAALVALLAFLAFRHAQDFRNARSVFLATVERNPQGWLAYDYLGSTPPSVGTPEGIDFLRRALRAKPDYAEAHYNLGVALAASGRLPGAVAEYRETLRLDPGFLRARFNLGSALMASEMAPEAMAQFREALRLEPAYAEAHYALGTALVSTGRLGEAVPEFREAVRLRPDYVEALNNLGGALRDLGRPLEAVAAFEATLRLAPGSYAAENNIGGVLMTMPGRIADAIGHFQAAERLAPPSAAIEANLGFALAAAGRFPEAIEHDQAALRLDPGFAAVRQNLGEALMRLGRIPEANAQFEEVARLRAGR
jgi:tetratricopeptide (TPR) repeat protein